MRINPLCCVLSTCILCFCIDTVAALEDTVLVASSGKNVVDLGTLYSGEVDQLQLEYRFLNDTDTLLKFERVSTDCGCITAQLAQADIATGETGTLSVGLDTRYLSFGAFKKNVIMFASLPRPTTYKVSFVGTLATRTAQLVASPSKFFAVLSMPQQKEGYFLQLSRSNDAPVGKFTATPSADWIHCKVKPYAENNEGAMKARLAVYWEAPSDLKSDAVEHILIEGAGPEDRLTVPIFINYRPLAPISQRYFFLEESPSRVRIPVEPRFSGTMELDSYEFVSDDMTLESISAPTDSNRFFEVVIAMKGQYTHTIPTGMLRCWINKKAAAFEVAFVSTSQSFHSNSQVQTR